jgi:hypothetical protein
VTKLFSQLVAMMVLGTVVAAGAEAMCALSAAHAPMAGCHPMQVPTHPHPVDYRCCMGRHAVPLVTKMVSPRPALQVLEADAKPILASANDDPIFPAILPTAGPPGVLVLRI